jgi:hypothetical protein
MRVTGISVVTYHYFTRILEDDLPLGLQFQSDYSFIPSKGFSLLKVLSRLF